MRVEKGTHQEVEAVRGELITAARENRSIRVKVPSREAMRMLFSLNYDVEGALREGMAMTIVKGTDGYVVGLGKFYQDEHSQGLELEPIWLHPNKRRSWVRNNYIGIAQAALGGNFGLATKVFQGFAQGMGFVSLDGELIQGAYFPEETANSTFAGDLDPMREWSEKSAYRSADGLGEIGDAEQAVRFLTLMEEFMGRHEHAIYPEQSFSQKLAQLATEDQMVY